MAIAIDTNTHLDVAASASTFTLSVVVNNPNSYLIINVISNTTTGHTVTSPAYNGTAMTTLQDLTPAIVIGHCYLFGLVNPSVGTHNFTCTTSGATDNIAAIALVYTGVDQTTPVDVSTTVNFASVTSISASLTATKANNTMVNFIFDNDGPGTLTASTNVVNTYAGYNTGVHMGGDNIGGTAPSVGVGYTQTWTISPAGNTAMFAAMLTPAATATTNTIIPTLLMLDVG